MQENNTEVTLYIVSDTSSETFTVDWSDSLTSETVIRSLQGSYQGGILVNHDSKKLAIGNLCPGAKYDLIKWGENKSFPIIFLCSKSYFSFSFSFSANWTR